MIEALSRGCDFLYSVDNQYAAFQVIKENLNDLKIENARVFKLDFRKALKRFNDEKIKDDFTSFDLLHYSQLGKVITLVIKGNQDEVVEKLEAMHPLILDVLSVTFEELFIYEMERRGYVSYE